MMTEGRREGRREGGRGTDVTDGGVARLDRLSLSLSLSRAHIGQRDREFAIDCSVRPNQDQAEGVGRGGGMSGARERAGAIVGARIS